eukprot:6470791-Amphidinium_carterae.2
MAVTRVPTKGTRMTSYPGRWLVRQLEALGHQCLTILNILICHTHRRAVTSPSWARASGLHGGLCPREVAITLMKEVLGVHVEVTGKASTSTTGLYATAGCVNPVAYANIEAAAVTSN